MVGSDGLAVLSYRTGNIGDDIQSLAASRLLPGPSCRVDRDTGTVQCLQPTAHHRHRLLANGWYSHNPGSWPWGPEVLPLLISVHLSPDAANALRASASHWNLRPEFSDYLKRWGPVGARDLSTLAAMQHAGIPSYMSGCVTLTLPENRGARAARTVLVDVPDDVARASFPALPGDVTRETHTVSVSVADADRSAHAARLVALYATSRLVVTTRLHAALPALAAGTPVIFIDVGQIDGRFEGLGDLLRIVQPRAVDTDWSAAVAAALVQPPQSGYSSLRDGLVAQVSAWLGQEDPAAVPDTGAMRYAAALAEARERGAQLEAVSADRDRLVVQLEQERAKAAERLEEERASSLERRELEAKEHHDRLSLEREVARKRSTQEAALSADLDHRLQAARSDRRRLEAELAAIRASSSWRLTAPMRHVRDALRI